MTGRKEETARVPLERCVARRLYRIRCRNLKFGVFDGKSGFIGVRLKFGHEYLFREYHWEIGPPYGTVFGVEDLGVDLPDDIEVRESTPTIDRHTGRQVYFDKPIADGGRGWVFRDTGESSLDILPTCAVYEPLFTWLKEQQQQIEEKETT